MNTKYLLMFFGLRISPIYLLMSKELDYFKPDDLILIMQKKKKEPTFQQKSKSKLEYVSNQFSLMDMKFFLVDFDIVQKQRV